MKEHNMAKEDKEKYIKSYTDIDQSRKLAEILPIESADMCFNTHNNMPPLMTPYSRFKEFYDMEPTPDFLIPSWSLAELINVLPSIHALKPILDLEENSIQYSGIDIYVKADNLVDACYKTILKLHELKKL